MTQKTNEQGQKVYEVLSEEYIRLKELELTFLSHKIYSCLDEGLPIPKEWYEEQKELESHIEDLKCEIEESISIDGMTDWRDTQIN